MKEWTNLIFTLTKSDNTTLVLGGSPTGAQICKYTIKKDNGLFNSIMSFDYKSNERSIPIEVYINSMLDIRDFRDFFESTSSYELAEVYDLEILANEVYYYGTCILEDSYDITEIEDLYGSKTATVKLDLTMNDPFFYSSYSYTQSIGSGTTPCFELPIAMNKAFYLFSLVAPLVPHIIDNKGNEDNGIIIKIVSTLNLTNPKIINETTGFTMGLILKTDLHDTIEIDTKLKTVRVNGKIILNAKCIGDKWMKLERGVNVMKFKAEHGENNASVTMSFKDKYRAIV